MTHPDPAPAASRANEVALPREVKIALVVLVFSAMVMILNETILSVALPSIMTDFGVPATTAQWLTTGFMLTMAIVIPTTGFLLQRFTTRAIFLAAQAVFLAGTVVAALAPVFPVLLVGRILQATGTALIMPLLMTVAMTVVPPQRRGTVMGLISIVMAVAPALGPTASGFILNALTWHWLFWVMVPLILVTLLVGLRYLKNVGETEATPLDILSVIVSAIAFGGLIYALSSLSVIIEGEGAERWITLAIGVAGLLALIIFAVRQTHLSKRGAALLDLAVFKIRNFTVAMAVLLVTFGALLGSVTILPIYLQTSMGATALITGLLLLPGGLINALISPFVGRIYDRVGPRPLLVPGMTILTGALFWMSTLDENSTETQMIAMHVVFSIGLALIITPLMTTALGSLPARLYGHGSAALNTLQQLAGATGTALLIVALSHGTNVGVAAGESVEVATAHGTHTAFLIAGFVGVVALLASPFVTKVAEDQHEAGHA
ncbi:MDR family MFS transporter [Corynebacterium halotolerans]|uniref:MDR family MFS transporter n=1 Tax=Corynebacterium halotolerans TaxID=225326 RepID=UPI003CFA6C23